MIYFNIRLLTKNSMIHRLSNNFFSLSLVLYKPNEILFDILKKQNFDVLFKLHVYNKIKVAGIYFVLVYIL